ncbi:MAG: T9SS type A sorting domain-containing protein [candidate division WOR-3 bacterium]
MLILFLIFWQLRVEPIDINARMIPSTGFGVELMNDNGTPSSFGSFWDNRYQAAEKLWTIPGNYPIRIDTLKIALYRHATQFAETTRFRFHVYSCDTAGRPIARLAGTDTVKIGIAQAPAWVWALIPFSNYNVIITSAQQYFDVVVEWLDPRDSVASILMDNQRNIRRNINWYAFQGTWYEHYDWWSQPTQVGVNMIRAIVTPNAVKVGESDQRSRAGRVFSINPIYRNGMVRFYLEKPEDVIVKLYNVNGACLRTLDYGFKKEGWNLVKFPVDLKAGIYFLSIRHSNKEVIKKIIFIPYQ